MTPSSVTCPHCQTSFRITKAQLNAADGSVRCGSCLQVFNAVDQLEQAPPASTPDDDKATPDTTITDEQPNQNPLIQQQTPATETIAQPDQDSGHEIKAEIASAPVAFNGHQQQTIDRLIEELDEQESESTVNTHQHRRVRWIIAALILSLLLLGQFAWFNLPVLSLNPALRGAYASVCQLLDCTLPPQVNIQAIRSLELVVRSHPNHQDVLQVDTVIINEADHTQPFPDLQLTFTDINGRVVANRTFTPTEYLAGELAGSRVMPKAQPVRLGLEIIDPGEEAVNYQLKFSASQPTKMP